MFGVYNYREDQGTAFPEFTREQVAMLWFKARQNGHPDHLVEIDTDRKPFQWAGGWAVKFTGKDI